MRWLVFHPKRIPSGGWYDLEGDTTVIHLIPVPRASRGNSWIIRQRVRLQAIATSFDVYLDRVAQLVEKRQLVVVETDSGPQLNVPDGTGRWEWLVRGEPR